MVSGSRRAELRRQSTQRSAMKSPGVTRNCRGGRRLRSNVKPAVRLYSTSFIEQEEEKLLQSAIAKSLEESHSPKPAPTAKQIPPRRNARPVNKIRKSLSDIAKKSARQANGRFRKADSSESEEEASTAGEEACSSNSSTKSAVRTGEKSAFDMISSACGLGSNSTTSQKCSCDPSEVIDAVPSDHGGDGENDGDQHNRSPPPSPRRSPRKLTYSESTLPTDEGCTVESSKENSIRLGKSTAKTSGTSDEEGPLMIDVERSNTVASPRRSPRIKAPSVAVSGILVPTIKSPGTPKKKLEFRNAPPSCVPSVALLATCHSSFPSTFATTSVPKPPSSVNLDSVSLKRPVFTPTATPGFKHILPKPLPGIPPALGSKSALSVETKLKSLSTTSIKMNGQKTILPKSTAVKINPGVVPSINQGIPTSNIPCVAPTNSEQICAPRTLEPDVPKILPKSSQPMATESGVPTVGLNNNIEHQPKPKKSKKSDYNPDGSLRVKRKYVKKKDKIEAITSAKKDVVTFSVDSVLSSEPESSSIAPTIADVQMKKEPPNADVEAQKQLAERVSQSTDSDCSIQFVDEVSKKRKYVKKNTVSTKNGGSNNVLQKTDNHPGSDRTSFRAKDSSSVKRPKIEESTIITKPCLKTELSVSVGETSIQRESTEAMSTNHSFSTASQDVHHSGSDLSSGRSGSKRRSEPRESGGAPSLIPPQNAANPYHQPSAVPSSSGIFPSHDPGMGLFAGQFMYGSFGITPGLLAPASASTGYPMGAVPPMMNPALTMFQNPAAMQRPPHFPYMGHQIPQEMLQRLPLPNAMFPPLLHGQYPVPGFPGAPHFPMIMPPGLPPAMYRDGLTNYFSQDFAKPKVCDILTPISTTPSVPSVDPLLASFGSSLPGGSSHRIPQPAAALTSNSGDVISTNIAPKCSVSVQPNIPVSRPESSKSKHSISVNCSLPPPKSLPLKSPAKSMLSATFLPSPSKRKQMPSPKIPKSKESKDKSSRKINDQGAASKPVRMETVAIQTDPSLSPTHCEISINTEAPHPPRPFAPFKIEMSCQVSPVMAPAESAFRHASPCKPAEDSGTSVAGPSGSSQAEKQATKKLQQVFKLSEKELSNPIDFFSNQIEHISKFGVVKIVLPKVARFKSCGLKEGDKFTPDVQYLSRAYKRWGPNTRQWLVIQRHLMWQKIELTEPPSVCGLEVDLPQLLKSVEALGGADLVSHKKRWDKVAEHMGAPKALVTRFATKIQNVFSSKLYSLSIMDERGLRSLEAEVDADTEIHHQLAVIAQGSPMTITQFRRNAETKLAYHSAAAPKSSTEDLTWKFLEDREHHVTVQTAKLCTTQCGSGFPKHSKSSKLGCWNMNGLCSSSSNILRFFPRECSGITSSFIKLGMAFSVELLNMDPQSLPMVEYLHEGCKVWYSIDRCHEQRLMELVQELGSTPDDSCVAAQLNPRAVNKSDVIIPPSALTAAGIPFQRLVQNAGEFVLIAPNVINCAVHTDTSVSECSYFASLQWLMSAHHYFTLARNEAVPLLFALEELLHAILEQSQSDGAELRDICRPLFSQYVQEEISHRAELCSDFGIKGMSRDESDVAPPEWGDCACDVCEYPCYFSLLLDCDDETLYCLTHGLDEIRRTHNTTGFKLIFNIIDMKPLSELCN